MSYDPTGGLFGRITRGLGLPEMGVSEAFGGKVDSLFPQAYADVSGTTNPISTGGGGGAGGNEVLGDTYGPFPTGGSAPSGGSVQGTSTLFSEPSDGGGDIDTSGDDVRDAINSGYDDYFSQLDSMLNQGLPAQMESQKNLANLQYTGGVQALQPQLQSGQNLLGRQRERTTENQSRNLRDLSSNLRNAFMTGNVFLGSRGAGDSSAANQYSYGLTKLGSQQRGGIMRQSADVMREIGDRETNLKNVYNAETNRLANERDQKIMSLSSWFAEQQNALRQAQAEGSLAKGQDLANLSQNLLNAALNQLNFVQQEASNRRSALEQWALNNANSIKQVTSNLQQVSNFQPALPQSQPVVGQPTIQAGGGFNVPGFGYGGVAEEEQGSLFQPAQ